MPFGFNREIRGKQIAELPNQIRRIDENEYRVLSQSCQEIEYQLHKTEIGWTCSCPDFAFRRVQCKHQFAVLFSLELRKSVESSVVIEPITALACPKCKSDKIVKKALRYNKYGDIQRYLCKSCNYRFTINLGFERMKHNPQAITSAMQLYFGGESLRNTQASLKLLGTQVSYQTVHNWIRKYISLMDSYLERIKPQVSETWRTDELYFKVRGNQKYLFALMDDQTRFWIAQQVADTKGLSDIRQMFKDAKMLVDVKPKKIISDGAQNFARAIEREYAYQNPRPIHERDIRLGGEIHNNKMERMNGEIRDREKVTRNLKSVNSPVLKGIQLYHNYIRPHISLDGKTPSEMAGIKVNGENKWNTIIQNASTFHSDKLTAKA
jgi:putative transposase